MEMYCLNTYVQPGDIILVRGAAKASKLISLATKGHFSHACVVISKTRAIEAIFDGVKITTLSRFVVQDKKNIRILRPIFESSEQKAFLHTSIEDFSYAYQGRGYNLADAAKSIFKLEFAINDESMFCSQLVAALFEEAKFPLFEKHVHNVNPNDYLKSDKLSDITVDALSEIPEYIKKRAAKNEDEINPIDVKNGGSTSFEPAKLLREFVEECGPIFTKHNLRRPNTVFDIVDRLTGGLSRKVFEDIDKKVTSSYRKNGPSRNRVGTFNADEPHQALETNPFPA
jgi:Permuted papain-like amidase enzyme, YaeF/YiiX, C92 family